MSFEFIKNPQVFIAPITAVMGLQQGLEKYPYIVGYERWSTTINSTNSGTTINVPGAFLMAAEPEAYIINVGGVIQHPSEYTVNTNTRTINFTFTLSTVGLVVDCRQLATTAPSAAEFNLIKAVNTNITNTITAANADITNLIVRDLNIVSFNVFNKTTLTHLASAVAIKINGNTFYLPLLSAI